MKRFNAFVLALLLLSSLWPQVTVAQAPPATLPPNTVYGRLGAGQSGPGQALPFANLGAALIPYLPAIPGTPGVDTNVLNSQVANYSLLPTDCGKTLQLGTGSTGFFTVTVPSVSGFSTTCSVKIVNGDSTNGKAIAGLTGVPGNMLWPGQAATVKIINGAWAWTEKPGAWVLTSNLTFYVDPSNGCAAATVPTCDGLGTGTDAFSLVQTGVSFLLNQINTNGNTVIILLADATYTEQVSCTGKFIGTTEIFVEGASGHTANVIWNVSLTGAGTGFFFKDYCAIWLDNMTINVANSAIGVVTNLFGNVDVGGGVAFGSASGAQGTTGTAISIGPDGHGSATGNFSINGSFNFVLLVQGGKWVWGSTSHTGASGLTWASAFQAGYNNGFIDGSAGSLAFPGFSGVSGYRFQLKSGSTLLSGGVDPNTVFAAVGNTNGTISQSTVDGGAFATTQSRPVGPATSVNFGVAGDYAVNTPLPSGYTKLCSLQIAISGASGDISSATYGLFTATGGSGTIIASGAAITVTSGTANTNNNYMQANATNIATETFTPTNGQIFFRVGTTVAKTANVQASYIPCP